MVSLDLNVQKHLALSTRQTHKKSRIIEIDFLRGFSVFLMVLYHFAYDLSALDSFFVPIVKEGFVVPGYVQGMLNLGHLIWWRVIPTDSPLQVLFSGLFMFLCGISCTFARNNAKRGSQLLFLGLLMTIFLDDISLWMGFNIHIWFGIIQSLAIAILVYACLNHFFSGPYESLGFAIYFAILYCFSLSYIAMLGLLAAFLLVMAVAKRIRERHLTNESLFNSGFLFLIFGLFLSFACSFIFIAASYNSSIEFLSNFAPNMHLVTVYSPEQFPAHCLEMAFGKAQGGDDYFSPILTSMLVFLGAAVGKTIYKKRKSIFSSKLPTKWATPINWLGQHSLVVYILHQPLSILFLYCLVAPAGYTFA